jgi:hypothetical protein
MHSPPMMSCSVMIGLAEAIEPAAARALRLTIQAWEVRAAGGFERVFAALDKERPDGLYVPSGRYSVITENGPWTLR